MTKPLTLLNREDKGDVDLKPRDYLARKLNAGFPSYFSDFYFFTRFITLRIKAALKKCRVCSGPNFPLAAAFMAIV